MQFALDWIRFDFVNEHSYCLFLCLVLGYNTICIGLDRILVMSNCVIDAGQIVKLWNQWRPFECVAHLSLQLI